MTHQPDRQDSPGPHAPKKPFRVISWGCGIQSTTLAVMSALGDLPRVDAVITADTGWERQLTYEAQAYYSTWLRERGIPVDIVTATFGSIKDHNNSQHIPFWTAAGGPIRRQCTRHFKIEPVKRRIRELTGYKPSTPPNPKPHTCEMWIGFSLDEFSRVKQSRVQFIDHRWPLLEHHMTRSDCTNYLEEHNLPVPPKSACVCCPYRQASSWIDMRDTSPHEFAAAVAFDEKHRHIPYLDRDLTREDTALYLYKHGGPLRDANLEADAAKELTKPAFQLPLLCESGYCWT